MPRGSGGAHLRPGGTQAAPIPRPSYDYEWKIHERAYGDQDEKASRAAEREREAEERQNAINEGKPPDLGTAGDQWASAVRHLSGGGGGSWSRGGNSYPDKGRWTQPSWPSYAGAGSNTGSHVAEDPWSKFNMTKGKAGTEQQQKPGGGSQERARTVFLKEPGTGGGGQWESGSLGGANRGQAQGGGQDPWGNWTPTTAAGRSQPASTSDRHNLAAAQDAPRILTAGHQGQAKGQGSWGNWTPTTIASTIPAAEDQPRVSGKHGGGVPDAARAAPPASSLDRPFGGLDDAGLQSLCERMAEQLQRGVCIPVFEKIELADTTVTDQGLCSLVAFLAANSVRVSELSLVGASGLKTPTAVVDLLRDPIIGLAGEKGGPEILRIDPAQASCEFFWRVLEACAILKRRPPMVLALCEQLGERLQPVLAQAIKRGLEVELRPPGDMAIKRGLEVELRPPGDMGSGVGGESSRIEADVVLVGS